MNTQHKWVSEASSVQLENFLIFPETWEELAIIKHINTCSECHEKVKSVLEEAEKKVDTIG